eukprot:379433-Amphidinium_carterae.1
MLFRGHFSSQPRKAKHEKAALARKLSKQLDQSLDDLIHDSPVSKDAMTVCNCSKPNGHEEAKPGQARRGEIRAVIMLVNTG